MTQVQVFEAGTDRVVDTITVTEDGEIDFATGAGRPALEALAVEYDRRGIRLPADQAAATLDGYCDGTVEMFAPDFIDPNVPVVPNVLISVQEAMSSDGSQLKAHWVSGPGAGKIRWGSDGDFNRCVRNLGKYVKDPRGLCNTYHQAAVGAPPGKGH